MTSRGEIESKQTVINSSDRRQTTLSRERVATERAFVCPASETEAALVAGIDAGGSVTMFGEAGCQEIQPATVVSAEEGTAPERWPRYLTTRYGSELVAEFGSRVGKLRNSGSPG